MPVPKSLYFSLIFYSYKTRISYFLHCLIHIYSMILVSPIFSKLKSVFAQIGTTQKGSASRSLKNPFYTLYLFFYFPNLASRNGIAASKCTPYHSFLPSAIVSQIHSAVYSAATSTAPFQSSPFIKAPVNVLEKMSPVP